MDTKPGYFLERDWSAMTPTEPLAQKSSAPAPFLISWNITKRCNLKCSHCYLDAAELEGRDEISTAEAEGFIREIAGLNPKAMLILTGGEPLLRSDWGRLSRYATSLGLMVVVGTNGMLLDDAVAVELRENGVKGVGVSIDSAGPTYHDSFRGLPGAWDRTIFGIEALRRKGMDFQVQFSLTRENRADLPAVIELADRLDARAINVFFLVCTGRGQNITDLSPEEYEAALEYLVKAEKEYEGRLMVRARCAPHFLRVASAMNPDGRVLRGETSGCVAGRGYLRISPEGNVTACPYMPASVGEDNLRRRGLGEIWNESPVFRSLRDPVYSGRCGRCEFNEVCGGCRARAFALSGDMMGEDRWCAYEPSGKKETATAAGDGPVWSGAARERLMMVPAFLRSMVKDGVERYARSKGLGEITPDVMSTLRKRALK